jgi:acyl carrier protein
MQFNHNLEEEFQISITDEEAVEQMLTVRDVLEYLRGKGVV